MATGVNSHTRGFEVFTGQMPFLSPNQQCQSTEGWQCSWRGTARCHHAAKYIRDTVMVAWAALPSSFKGAFRDNNGVPHSEWDGMLTQDSENKVTRCCETKTQFPELRTLTVLHPTFHLTTSSTSHPHIFTCYTHSTFFRLQSFPAVFMNIENLCRLSEEQRQWVTLSFHNTKVLH